MSEWKHLYVHKNMIKFETGNAALIAVPEKSEYRNYCIWISNKLIKLSLDRKMYNISYKDDFTFCLRKYSKDDWKNPVEEIEIGAEELEELFDGRKMKWRY